MIKNEQKILGIDYGMRKIGLSVAEGVLAEPIGTLIMNENDDIFIKIKQIINKEKINKIIIGISEGNMAIKTKIFSKKLAEIINIPVIIWDETLSSAESRKKMAEMGKLKKDRNLKEHSIAATLILQDYLDNKIQ